MLTKIQDDETRAIYVAQIDQLIEKLAYQSVLPPDARIDSILFKRLESIKAALEREVALYDKMDDFT